MRVVDHSPNSQWLYKGQPATPCWCEVGEDRKVTVLFFRLENGARVRTALDPDTDTFEDVVYRVLDN